MKLATLFWVQRTAWIQVTPPQPEDEVVMRWLDCLVTRRRFVWLLVK